MLTNCPIDLEAANAFVKRVHRHHAPVPGCKFCLAATDGETVRGVVIVGRPVSRNLDDGWTLEVNRCCTDGVRNGCSLLYGAARRIARDLGYRRIITYTLPEEGGSSLRASGWGCVGEAGGGAWIYSGKPRRNEHPLSAKWRWECVLRSDECNVDWRELKEKPTTERQSNLF